jgi:hypothetical protein
VKEINDVSVKIYLNGIELTVPCFNAKEIKSGEKILLVVKPNAVEPVKNQSHGLEGRVVFREFQGTHTSVGVETIYGIIPVMVEVDAPLMGENIKLRFKEKLLTIVKHD